MRRLQISFWLLGAAVITSTALLAQARPAFEVASVRPSADQGQQGVAVGLRITGAQARIATLSIRDYIALAYRVRTAQVIAPEWTAQVRYDIAGTIPAGNTREQVPEMVLSLLEDRFQLKAHHEMRDLPVYALTVGKNGLHVKPVPEDAQASAPAVDIKAGGSASGIGIDLGGGSSFSIANNRFEVHRLTFQQMADVLSRFLDRPLVNLTNQPGRYDIVTDLSPEDYQVLMMRAAIANGVVLPPQALRLLENATGNPLANALDASGLIVDARKASFDTIVVDAVQRTPTEN